MFRFINWLRGSSEPKEENVPPSVVVKDKFPQSSTTIQLKDNIRGSQGLQGLDEDTPADPELPPIDLPSDPPSSTADELDQFQNTLLERKKALEVASNKLEQLKIDIMGQVKGLNANQGYPNVHERKTLSFVRRIFLAVKQFSEFAPDELDELLDGVRPHLEDLEKHIDSLSKTVMLNQITGGAHLTTAEKRETGIDICDTGIELAIEMQDFIDGVMNEINTCVKSEKALEVGLIIGIFLLTGKSLGGFGNNLSQQYRDSLNTRITVEKININLFEINALGTLKEAATAVEKLLEDLRASEKAKPSNTGLFAAEAPVSVIDQPKAATSLTR